MRWYDEENYTPYTLCEVELKDGSKMQAYYVCGNYETKEGKVIYPIKFRPLGISINKGLYSLTCG